MKYLRLTLLFMLSFWLPLNLFSQAISAQEQGVIDQYFFGNTDYYLGYQMGQQGKPEEGRSYLQKAIKTFKKQKNWPPYITASAMLMRTYAGTSSYRTGIKVGEKVERIVNRKAPRLGGDLGVVQKMTGVIYQQAEDWPLANKAFQKELQLLLTRYGNSPNFQLGLCYADLGFTYEKMDRYPAALTHFVSAKAVFQNLSDCPNCAQQLVRLNEKIGFLHCHIGEEHYNNGEKVEARPFYQAGVAAFQEGEHWALYIQAVADLLNTYVGTDEQQIAIAMAEAALQQLEDKERQSPSLAMDKIYHQLGRLHNDIGATQLAIEAFEQEVQLLQKRGEARKSEAYADAYIGLGVAYSQQGGALSTAKDYFLDAATILTGLEDCLDCSGRLKDVYDNLGIVIGVLAKNELELGHTSAARGGLEESRGYFLQVQNWPAYIECTILLMETYLNTRNYQKGISIGEKGLQSVAEEAPTFLSDCHGIYQMQGLLHHGNFEAARSLQAYRKGLDLLQQKYGIDTSYHFARAYNNIAACYSDLGQLDTAVLFFDKAIATYPLAKDCEDCRFDLATAYGNRANMYFSAAEVEKGITYLEKAIDLSIAAEGRASLKLIRKYLNLAFFYLRLEETAESMRYLERIIYLIEQEQPATDGSLTAMYAEAFALLGSNRLYQQQYDEARQAYEKAIDLLSYAPADHPIKILALTNLGRIHLEQQDFEPAAAYLEQASALFESSPTDRKNAFYDFALGMELQMQSSLLGRMTGQINQAISSYDRAFGILDETGFFSQQIAVRLHLQLAQLYHLKNELEPARSYCRQALQAACRETLAVDEDVLPRVQHLFSIPEVYDILNLRASLLYRKGQLARSEAEKETWLSQAVATLSLADTFHTENLKKASLLSGSQYRQLVEKSIQNYQAGIAMAYDLFQLNTQPQSLEKAFYFAQQMKSQQLWLAILQSEAHSLGLVDQALLQEEKQVLTEMSRYEALWQAARQENDQAAMDRIENQLLFESKKRHQALVRKIEGENPTYVQAKYRRSIEKSEAIQSLLKEDELIIEYVQAGGDLYIFTLDKGQILQVKKVDFLPATPDRVSSLLAQLRNTSWVRKSNREKFIQTNYRLYQQFIFPIENHLEGKRRLIIIHDGLSHYLPFETLLASEETRPFTSLEYLIKNYEVSYHYSTRLFAAARRKEKVPSKTVYSFAPVYDRLQDFPNTDKTEALKSTWDAVKKDGQFTPLPESEKEAQSILNLMEATGSKGSLLSLRAAAHEASLKQNLESPYQFIHIAGHSFANTVYPQFSGIACYPSEDNKGEDGILYSGEIYTLRMQTDLLTMSSCESGFGQLDHVEGLQGLNRAFVYAGVPNVVFSLWKVYDKVSAQLMVDFYTEILAGKDYATALRQAKLNLLWQEPTAAPHFWSPYLLIGR